MSKAPSTETQLRTAKRELALTRDDLDLCKRQREDARAQAHRLANELAEWKARFDKLLDRTPKEQA